MNLAGKIAKYIRKDGMIAAGERIGVAVSGGADSVALLRALLELGGELGCVLAVVHFNHKIRPEADSDAEFAEGSAREHGLEFFGGSGDVKAFAVQQRVSLETAARELRYEFFLGLGFEKIATAHTLDDQAETVLMKVLRGAGTRGLSGIWPSIRRQEAGRGKQEQQHSAISTQHSGKQNQMRTAEGGGATQNLAPSTSVAAATSARDDNQMQTQGPSTARSSAAADSPSLGVANVEVSGSENDAGGGVHTVQIIRPMLGVRRGEVEQYLRSLGQEWREDASNRDVKHTRNRVRHELLPLLEREYNPNIYQQLADAAEVARGDEEYWAEEIRRQENPRQGPSTPLAAASSAQDDNQQYPVLSTQYSEEQVPRPPRPSRDANSLDMELLLQQPLALRRRVVREVFRRVSGKALDFEHTDALVRFLERRESSLLQLPERWSAVLDWPGRTVGFEEREPQRRTGTITGKSPSKSMAKKSGRLAGRKV